MECTCTIDDYDCYENEFYEESHPIASREHVCCECHQIIRAGEQYERVKGKSDGCFWTYKTCEPCYELRSCFFCTWFFEHLYERLSEEISEIKLSGLESLSKEARIKFFENVNC